ncbi:MAG: GNAT family protein [Candidatus Dormiibacterota bacterium]|jgi:ribosomal-protein-alanine N-acetyltransferase
MTAPVSPSVALVPWSSLAFDAILDLLRRNREHLAPWEPLRGPDHLTEEMQRRLLAEADQAERAGREAGFGVTEVPSGALVGHVRISGIERGAFQSAHLGYFIDRDRCGRGYATEAVGAVTRWAFTTAGLHRLQASVMPHNLASIRVLEKAGYRREGLSVRYLKIAGSWRDHLLFARTVEDGP